ncbi:TRAP transporter substrate-binding protein DctP [Corticimicrobacter populi]|uniref:TRAP transporter substrate-binding protein DctP n=2 Tax=Corticimicrobacter populi TaxID=2175229 RepID=A0A2V1K0U4_9BURK|nr:TRAP transporter substrate-binding protein DctP [Corticimicrobacter populi]
MRMTASVIVKKLCAAGLLGLAGMGAAVAATTVNLSYNGAPDPQKNAVHVFAQTLKELVEEKTQGELKITLYPNSMLGDEEARMEQTMAAANLNIASFSGISPLAPEIFVSAIPFMFSGFEPARHFFDGGEYWKALSEAFRERTGVEMLAVVEEGGFLAFTNSKKAIRTPDDFKGLRFRAMDPSQVALYESFGATGTPIPWTEVYMALRTGVADGQMNPPMYIILGSLYEVQKYLTLANIQYSDQFLVGNAAFLDSLSEPVRAAFHEAVREANQKARTENERDVESRIQYLADKGMEVIHLTDEERAAFRTKAQPSYMNWLHAQGIDRKWIDMALKDAGLEPVKE